MNGELKIKIKIKKKKCKNVLMKKSILLVKENLYIAWTCFLNNLCEFFIFQSVPVRAQHLQLTQMCTFTTLTYRAASWKYRLRTVNNNALTMETHVCHLTIEQAIPSVD